MINEMLKNLRQIQHNSKIYRKLRALGEITC